MRGVGGRVGRESAGFGFGGGGLVVVVGLLGGGGSVVGGRSGASGSGTSRVV